MQSPTYGSVTIEEVAKIVTDYILSDTSALYEVNIGTDSQTYADVKIVEVVAVHRVGKGGIYFYRKEYVSRFHSLKEKIFDETSRSINLANMFYNALELEFLEHDKVLEDYNIHNQIHCDIGTTGATNALIPEITGWVRSAGYECCIKPDSYAASGVANKLSK
jgi:hypothetical protein